MNMRRLVCRIGLAAAWQLTQRSAGGFALVYVSPWMHGQLSGIQPCTLCKGVRWRTGSCGCAAMPELCRQVAIRALAADLRCALLLCMGSVAAAAGEPSAGSHHLQAVHSWGAAELRWRPGGTRA